MVVDRYCKIFLSHKEVVKFPIILPCIINANMLELYSSIMRTSTKSN